MALTTTTLVYDVRIYTPRGSTIDTFLPSGQLNRDDIGCGDDDFFCFMLLTDGELPALVMRQAVAQFMVQFYESQKVKDWLKEKEITP